MSMTPKDRIIGLWYKANVGYNTGTFDNADAEIIEKFAQLIAADCISVVSEYGLHGGELIVDDLRECYGLED